MGTDVYALLQRKGNGARTRFIIDCSFCGRGGEPLAGEIIKLNERRRSQYAVQVTLMPLAGERLETLFLRQENFTK